MFLSAEEGEALRMGATPTPYRSLKSLMTEVPPGEQRRSFSAFGVDFTICSVCDQLLRDCLPYLPPCRTETTYKIDKAVAPVTYRIHLSAGRKSALLLTVNGRKRARCYDRTEFLERFGSTVALHVADNSRKLVFLHAGVVGWGELGIVIPGRSFSGKTTLVAELVRAGATYYSDEFAVVDRQGRVHPYPRPLQIRDGCSYRQTRCPVASLGGTAGEKPLRIGLVIFSQYREGASWLPEELSPGINCLRMLDNTISARSAPAIALSTLKRVASKTVAVSGTRGDSHQIIQWIIAKFGPLPSRSAHSA